MDAKTHNMPPGGENKKVFSGDQVVGRQKPAHHQEYCSDVCGVCIQVSSHVYGFCCGSDYM
jgi:hypothetical protein